MILRKLANAFAKQQWSIVFLEIVILVTGIFIGLQVDDWNENRKLRALERDYLLRLYDDIDRSREDASSNIDEMAEQFELQGFVLDRLRKCQLADDEREKFSDGIAQVGQFYPTSLVRDTIDELASVGHTSVIRNQDVRKALADLDRRDERSSSILDYIVNRATPQIVYVDSRATIHIEGSETDPFAYTPGSMKLGAVDFDFAALCKDPRYLSAMSSIRFMTRVLILGNEGSLRRYAAAKTLIEGELGYQPAVTEAAD